MQTINKKAEKARNMRYKKAILEELNLASIRTSLEEISTQCDDVKYYFDEDGETLLNALDGDEDEEFEIRMMFSELCAECEKLYDIISDNYVVECFDDFFVSLMLGGESPYQVLGYDSYEEDYFHISSYESRLASDEATKRIQRLTKAEIILAAGQCFGIVTSFFNIQYKFDYLQAAFDILRGENTSFLKVIKDIEKAYSDADEDGFGTWEKSTERFERLIRDLPDTVWVQ